MIRNVGITAAALGATAVLFGAFGAHALRGHFDENALSIWRTAVDYQFWHALALLAIAGFAPADVRRWPRASGILIAGTLVFCASLYALALGAPSWIGVITPFGGVLLVTGWVVAGAAFWCSASNK
ncbi:MAG TPA: DUF423 domain-containing protein [Rudaea sp.]|nr:DUF423 domain-containing protein [Rudaea sp.]